MTHSAKTDQNTQQRLAEVRALVDSAAQSAGRDSQSITLIAVSKTQPAEAIVEAIEAGQIDFGENNFFKIPDIGRKVFSTYPHNNPPPIVLMLLSTKSKFLKVL